MIINFDIKFLVYVIIFTRLLKIRTLTYLNMKVILAVMNPN